MRKPTGVAPSLTQSQIQRVLHWHARLIRFRTQQPTLARLAHTLGLTVRSTRRLLQGDADLQDLSKKQLRTIQRWQSRARRFHAQHVSSKTLARELGVSRSTLFDCISRQGRYALDSRAGKRTALRQKQKRRARAINPRNLLLRAWCVVSIQEPHAGMPRRSRTAYSLPRRGARS